ALAPTISDAPNRIARTYFMFPPNTFFTNLLFCLFEGVNAFRLPLPVQTRLRMLGLVCGALISVRKDFPAGGKNYRRADRSPRGAAPPDLSTVAPSSLCTDRATAALG